jgi:hypothetical protein
MARKSYYPVATKMEIGSSGPSQVNTIIEAPHVLSMVNKRLYRQQRVYRCKVNLTGDGAVAATPVYALAPTWWVMNSLKQARKHFELATKEEVAQSGRSRWYDFRIDPNATGATFGLPLLNDLSGGASSHPSGTAGEYVYSSIRDSLGNDRAFVLEGATSTTRYNVFDEYDKMGDASSNPSSSTIDGGYSDLVSAIDDENVEHLQDDGNLPPYSFNLFPSKVFVKVGELYRDADGTQRSTTGYFDAPLGIIWIPNWSLSVNGNLELEVQGGDYKGVNALEC